MNTNALKEQLKNQRSIRWVEKKFRDEGYSEASIPYVINGWMQSQLNTTTKIAEDALDEVDRLREQISDMEGAIHHLRSQVNLPDIEHDRTDIEYDRS